MASVNRGSPNQPFILRFTMKLASPDSIPIAVGCLNRSVEHQIVHEPGVLTYFFAVREDALEIDFFEVYRNEEVFWRHGTPPACPQPVVDALAKMFEPDVKLSSVGVLVGDPTEGVQATIAFMNGRVVPLVTGYVDGTTRRPSKLPVSPNGVPAVAAIRIPNVMGRKAPPATTDKAIDLAKSLFTSWADMPHFTTLAAYHYGSALELLIVSCDVTMLRNMVCILELDTRAFFFFVILLTYGQIYCS
jgi:hypothetical protein